MQGFLDGRHARAWDARSGRSAALLVAALGLATALLLWAPWAPKEGPDSLSPTAEAESLLDTSPVTSIEAIVPIQESAPETRARMALAASPDTTGFPAGVLDAKAAQPAGSSGEATLLALRGQVDLYVDKQLTQSRLSGSIDIQRAGDASWTTVKLEDGVFELVLHRQPSGEYATSDSKIHIRRNLEHARFRVAAPRSDGVKPLLHYYPKTGAPRRGAELILLGTTDAIVPVTEAPALELAVLERGTGAHLDQVNVVAVRDHGGAVYQRSGEGEMLLASQQASPMRLVPGEPLSHSTSTVLAVDAPGYGREEITVDFTSPHSRAVELSPGGRLVVRIEGDIPRRAELHLLGQGKRFEPAPAQNDDTSFENLVPARYHARVRLRATRRDPWVEIVGGTVTVDPHQTAVLTLAIPSVEAVVRADLAGVLILPPEWKIQDKTVTGTLLGVAHSRDSRRFEINDNDFVPIAGRPGAYAFEKNNLEVGRYSLRLLALPVKVFADLPPEGVRDVELIVAPPVAITVVTESDDQRAGASTAVDKVFWGPKRRDGDQGSSMSPVRRSASTGKFHLTVPAGEISLQAGGWFSDAETVHVLATEGLEVVLPVSSQMTAILELRDGDAVVPWPDGQSVSLQDANGNPVEVSTRAGVKPKIQAKRPGPHWIKVPSIGGYLAHDDVRVEMEPGRHQTVVVQLVRR